MPESEMKTLQERYKPGRVARCPHCGRDSHLFHMDGIANYFAITEEGERYAAKVQKAHSLESSDQWEGVIVWISKCSLCSQEIIGLEVYGFEEDKDGQMNQGILSERIMWPSGPMRPVPSEVPHHIGSDFREACEVLYISPKASAALSRRCLQAVLREKGETSAKKLVKQIENVLKTAKLPADLAKDLDAVRNIGNFAAHPEKSEATGKIVDVEQGEAEWNIEVLEGLFEHYYVAPKRRAERRAALNEKLADAKKPQMKQPPTA